MAELLVRMPADLHAALKARSKLEDRSMAGTIRVAVRRYLASPPGAGAQEAGDG